MKPSQIHQAVKAAVTMQRPLFIWGQPGGGKSSVVHQAVSSLKRNVIDVRLSLLESPDLRGFPMMKDGRMEFAIPSFLPTDPEADDVIFLDELNKGSDAVQAASYQLILDRRIGDYELPPNVSLIAAGNNEDDGAGVYSMSSALANRFMHAEYEVDLTDFRSHAMNAGFAQEVINFISFRPGLLHDFLPERRSNPTPRMWEYVSDIIQSRMDSMLERELITGTVGEGATAEFLSFLKIYRNLPDPDAVLMAPKAAAVPEDLATKYALCGALASRASEQNFERLVEYCNRLQPEFQVLCIRDSVTRNAKLANTKTFADWAIANADVLV